MLCVHQWVVTLSTFVGFYVKLPSRPGLFVRPAGGSSAPRRCRAAARCAAPRTHPERRCASAETRSAPDRTGPPLPPPCLLRSSGGRTATCGGGGNLQHPGLFPRFKAAQIICKSGTKRRFIQNNNPQKRQVGSGSGILLGFWVLSDYLCRISSLNDLVVPAVDGRIFREWRGVGSFSSTQIKVCRDPLDHISTQHVCVRVAFAVTSSG